VDPLNFLKGRMVIFLLPALFISLLSAICFGQDNLAEPQIKGDGAILMDVTTRTILFEKGPGTQIRLSGPQGIVAALLAFERGGLESTLEDLIYRILLESDVALNPQAAKLLAGSSDEFMKMATRRLKEMGLHATEISPDLDSLLTTPYELTLLSSLALQNKELADAVRRLEWQGTERVITNKNPILGKFQGADGIMMGPGYIVASATRNGQQLIAVVLGSSAPASDAQALLNFGFNTYQLYNFANRGDLLKRVSVKNGIGSTVGLVAARDLNLLLPRSPGGLQIEEVIEVREDVTAPIQQWEELGCYKILVDDIIVGSVELLADTQITKRGLPERIRDWFLLFINLFG
jgi:D-alanyl-D-alanine carboxypeptidase (penicillin-binding protein 5/6)